MFENFFSLLKKKFSEFCNFSYMIFDQMSPTLFDLLTNGEDNTQHIHGHRAFGLLHEKHHRDLESEAVIFGNLLGFQLFVFIL